MDAEALVVERDRGAVVGERRKAPPNRESWMHASIGDSSSASFERSSTDRLSTRPRRPSQRVIRVATRAAMAAISSRQGACSS
jgi:hypothetical protein